MHPLNHSLGNEICDEKSFKNVAFRLSYTILTEKRILENLEILVI